MGFERSGSGAISSRVPLWYMQQADANLRLPPKQFLTHNQTVARTLKSSHPAAGIAGAVRRLERRLFDGLCLGEELA
jgi:hypothetical protein